jgi:hypothetical protein
MPGCGQGARPLDRCRAALDGGVEPSRRPILHRARRDACTDLTGFGLLGHLVEMTKPSGVDAELDLSRCRCSTARRVRRRRHRQLAAAGQRASAQRLAQSGGGVAHPAYPLLFDPQTAGGLLASVPAERADDCLAALRAAGYQITTAVTARMERNADKRLRVGGVDVVIQVDSPAESMEHLDRVLDQFEDFCVVTQSVRGGFPVAVTVRDGTGKVLKGA